VTEELPSKATFHGDAGEVVSIRTPGGGGWGPPGVTTDSGERESGTSGQPAASDHPEAHG
jgi:N-methylhydantoinase B